MNNIKNIAISCCFTGHRVIKKDCQSKVRSLLKKNVFEMLELGVSVFITGCASGFDMMALEVLIEIKEKYDQYKDKMKIVCYIPCKNHTEKWSDEDIEKYRRLLEKADEQILVTDRTWEEDNKCMKKRNYKMVDDSFYCIAYYTGRRSGTMQTVNYAKRKGRMIINLYEKL